jgi:hypothetical protein
MIAPGGKVIDSQTVPVGPSDPAAVLKGAQRRSAILTASMLASLVVFLIIVEMLKRNPGFADSAGDGLPPLRIVFYAIAISMVFVINLVHGFMLKAEKSDDISRIAAKLATVNVIVSAMAETPLLLGFVLFMGWGYYTDFYILGFVTLYLMLRHFPFYGQWERFAKQRMGVKWPAGPVPG